MKKVSKEKTIIDADEIVFEPSSLKATHMFIDGKRFDFEEDIELILQ